MKKDYNYKKIIIFLLFVLIFITFLKPISDNDTFWHLKLGEYIYKNGVPKYDMFSWLSASTPLIMYPHEWLSQLIYYLFYHFTGEYGVIVLTAFLGAMLIYILYKINKENLERNLFLAVSAMLVLSLFIYKFIVLRPQIFQYYFILFALFIVYEYKKKSSNIIFITPLLMIFWVNFHSGSSALLLVILIIYTFISFLNFNIGNVFCEKADQNKRLKIIIVTVLSFLASFLNPTGYLLVVYPYYNVSSNVMLQNIKEWAVPNIRTDVGFYYYFVLALTVLALLVSKNKKDFFDLTLLALFAFMAASSIKFIGIFIVFSIYIILKYIKLKPFKVKDLYYYILILLMGIMVPVMLYVKYPSIKNKYDLKNYPSDEIINVLKSEGSERIFNDYGYGGYLIYNNIEVFIDGRYDLYAGEIFNDYLNITYGNDVEFKIVKKYDFDYFLVSKESRIDKILSVNENYVNYKEDKVSVLYKKSNLK